MSLDELSAQQQALVARWLPGAVVERDHSWGLVETQVLEMAHAGRRYIVKAAGAGDRHLAREIEAHHTWLTPWVSAGRAPVLLHHDLAARIIVTRYLPGELVLGSPYADEPDVFRQAGELLGQLHAQSATIDDDYEARENAKSLHWLSQPHRIAPVIEAALRAEISSWPTPPARLVPTHGDWQPRNWLVHEAEVRVIDLGRAALRPAITDLARLAAQDFRRDARLETAFIAGYGGDPRTATPGLAELWFRIRVREAIGTAVWAYDVGDGSFEAQGHRMVMDALSARQ